MADRKGREGEETPGIKVTDRRSFTREGERREAVGTTSIAGPTGETASRQREEPPIATPKAAAAARDPETGAPEPLAGAPSIDFVAFVHSLYMSALIALGEVENPYTRQFETNLDLARENIDILLMLGEKTRGNLSPQEESYLSQALPHVQMLYVNKAR